METSEAPRGVILVNLHAGAGRCSYCAEYTDWVARHSCGAILEGAVINGRLAQDPTHRQVQSVIDRLPSRWRLLGMGVIDKVNGRWKLSYLKTTDELLRGA